MYVYNTRKETIEKTNRKKINFIFAYFWIFRSFVIFCEQNKMLFQQKNILVLKQKKKWKCIRLKKKQTQGKLQLLLLLLLVLLVLLFIFFTNLSLFYIFFCFFLSLFFECTLMYTQTQKKRENNTLNERKKLDG